MIGYWDEPEKTAEADRRRRLDAHGRPRDDGRRAGYVNIIGRIKDMVIRGGENLYPREIEEFLHGAPGVMDVQVIGVPDREVRRGARTRGSSSSPRRDDDRGRTSVPTATAASRATRCPRYFTFVDPISR